MMRIGIQSGATTLEIGHKETYAHYREAGFEVIDMNINDEANQQGLSIGDYALANCIFERPMSEILAHFEPELAEIHRNGLAIGQAHAPFPAYVDTNPESLDHMIAMYHNCIRFCHVVGIPYLVIHGVCSHALSGDQLDALNDKLYYSLIPTLLEGNTVVCLENLFNAARDENGTIRFWPAHCSDPAAACAFIDRLNADAGRECFGLCLDTGHLNLLDLDIPSYIQALSHRIKVLHLHDNKKNGDHHLAPYTGTINWKALLEALKEVGYQGDLSFETFSQTSLKRIDREMLPVWLRLIRECGTYFKTLFE